MRTYLRDLRQTAARLTEFLERHALLPIRTPDIRKARSGSHILLFRVNDETVELLRILHERQDLPDEIDGF